MYKAVGGLLDHFTRSGRNRLHSSSISRLGSCFLSHILHFPVAVKLKWCLHLVFSHFETGCQFNRCTSMQISHCIRYYYYYCCCCCYINIFLTHPRRRSPVCIKMVYNICWRSFLRGHDPVTTVNYCTKNSDVTCPFYMFNVRTLFYFLDLCFLQ